MPLYLVSTPIGNREDLSARAQKALLEADLILCEDTRRTGYFLQSFGDKNKPLPPLLAFYEENERRKTPEIIKRLKEGQKIALVSSAGTPLICDPGFFLVREAIREGVEITAIPGPCAAITALILSGLPPDKFFFLGFLPKKEGKKRKIFEESAKIALSSLSSTFIFYESPYRLEKTLSLMKEILGNPQVAVARELTKVHEEVVRGSLEEVFPKICGRKIKGEVIACFCLN